MKLGTASLTVALLTSCWCSALPPKEHKDRAIDPRLSDKEHDLHGEHNNDYDHDAFLGEDEAKEFDDLSPEESKRRLGIIVDKIDKDGDGFVTEDELKHWIQYVQKKYVMDDTDRMWKSHENDLQGDRLSWDSYRNHTYGYQYEMNDDSKEFHNMLARDERRFKEADKDDDGKLTFEEFTAFVHPEEYKHMEEVVVLETIEDIDKDNDGLISLEEYIGDMWPNHNGEEPDWVKNERSQFHEHRDRNGDGKMDKAEVKEWIIPPDYDHSEAEARHLIYETDGDKDDKLSKEEILAKYDVFVGSQATDFGEALTRHDEF